MKKRNKRQKYNPEERFNFLKNLVKEFQETPKQDAKEQVLANLSNFAYDPTNFKFLNDLNIIPMFLAQLDRSDALCEYALGGLCNLASEPENCQSIVKAGGIQKIVQCLSSQKEETLINCVTTLMYLIDANTLTYLGTPAIMAFMKKSSNSENIRLKNLSILYLDDIKRWKK